MRELLLGGFWFADKTPLALWVYLDPVWADLICRAALSLAIPNGVLAIVNLLPVDPLVGGDMLNAILEKCFGKGATNAISMVVGAPFVPGLIVLGIIARGSFLLAVSLMLALGIATFNPRWIARRQLGSSGTAPSGCPVLGGGWS